ncbi:related to Translational activator GCN1 [Saccharomycodes ludwigii]|uniref:eIF-2-alpha kinase activator GCN1 n=1 Tax=Saccharomycodes ludwigii TaxID=36035 RepID=A0A376B1D8_9ASCO|nr:related to Translational activator GCN1 [Saccharomycodes ludwigii]
MEEILEILNKREIYSSPLSIKLPALKKIEEYVNESSNNDENASKVLNKISETLLQTFSVYQDQESKRLLENIFIGIMNKDNDNNNNGDTETVDKYCTFIMKIVSSKMGTRAVVDYINIFDWVVKFIENALAATTTAIITDERKLARLQKLLELYVYVTESIEISLEFSNKHDSKHKKRMRDHILQSTKKAFMKNASKKNYFLLFKEIDYTKIFKIPAVYSGVICLIGSLSKFVEHEMISTPAVSEIFINSQIVENFVSYFGKDVILSKNPPSVECLKEFLPPFVSRFLTPTLFTEHIVPNLEKCNLRSPEHSFVISTVLYTCCTFPVGSIFVSTKLLSQTLQSLKSSKEHIRKVSSNALISILQKDTTTEEVCEKIVDELFRTLKTNLSADFKIIAADILYNVPTVAYNNLASTILKHLSNYVSKESNEHVLTYELNAFCRHLLVLKDKDETNQMLKILDNGMNDQKLKKTWMCTILLNFTFASENVYQAIIQNQELCKFVSETLKESYKHDHLQILACVQFLETFGDYSTNEAFNFNDALEKLGLNLVQISLSRKLKYTDRLKGLALLSSQFLKFPDVVGKSVIAALEFICINASVVEEKLSVSMAYIVPVFFAISQKLNHSNEHISVEILINLLYSAQFFDSQLKKKNGWAGLALHAGLNPAEVISQNSSKIQDKLISVSKNKSLLTTPFAIAVFKSAAYSAFINPDVMTPILTKTIKDDFSQATLQLKNVTEQDMYIWKTEVKAGEPVIDVISEFENKKKNQISKNSKDYETLKWEESIRSKQKGKNILNNKRRYTKEEQALINTQLEKETLVRNKMDGIYFCLNRSVNIVSNLARDAIQVENGVSTWFPVAVSELLQLLETDKYYDIVKDLALHVFLELSSILTEKLGSARYFIGLAILRAYNVNHLPETLTQEPLLDLISRVLFKIKFLTDKAPLNAINLTYVLPLLIKVLEEGKEVALKNSTKHVLKTEFNEEDKEEEHLLLAVEIVSSHGEEFQDPNIPRADILSVLLSLLGLSTKAKLAKDCFNILCQNISVSPSEKDINMILSYLLTPNQFVRTTILETLYEEFDLSPFVKYSPEVFICIFDDDEASSQFATWVWESNNFNICDALINDLLMKFFGQEDSGLRLFVSEAYAVSANKLGSSDHSVFIGYVDKLMKYYDEKALPPQPILDEYGLVAVSAAEQKDPWEHRSTVALSLKQCIAYYKSGITSSDIVSFVEFLINNGALGDKSQLVREEMKDAGISMLTAYGAAYVEELIPIFEKALSSDTPAIVQENVIILYGSLARHLKESDPRVTIIVSKLLNTLDNQSEDVHKAVSACISPLVPLFRAKTQEFIEMLFQKLFDSSSPIYIRKGAAWGISGLVKGYGISSLYEFDIIRNLVDASEDKKDLHRRESVAFAFECLSNSLQQYFEPYVIEVLPNILKNLGDQSAEVRDASSKSTKAIMSHTTSFGVKKMIPVAIDNLDDLSWRTKRGSVELLGSMAYLDPTQLSASLSVIVPEIVRVLNDSHKEVRKSADQALKRFGEVIRNPEIQKLVPVLIKAIGDPTKYTEESLNALIKTQFVHYIDGPSLALIIHVIHRGMRDRSANTKRIACKIVGNMAILVDARDLVPYLHQLIEEVEIAMVDPVPSTRATASRALGALVERLGEEQFPDLIPSLLATLSDETKAGDRLGAAQGLAEVISGLGLHKLDELLPAILSGVNNYRAYVREGFIPLLLFLPVCFGAQFAPYINQIIQPILSGLADTDENISDTCLKAGKLIVKNYANKAIDLLLPELESGMFDENDRIRLSSVQLTADLLFQVTGISSKNEFDEDEEVEQQHSEIGKQMVQVLGVERRDRILASLFILRSDVSGIVRAATVDVWKALVPNTPRIIKETLPTLTNIIVIHLASPINALRNIAAQSLGDLVRRVGSNALSQLLPTLEGLLETAADSDSRQGVCIALQELITSSNPNTLVDFQEVIVRIIRITLVDGNETVREYAAASFDAYQEVVGKVAVDEILPHLLNMLGSSDNSEYALLALQEIMATKSEVIFPVLIPTLLAPPIDAFRARALGSLAEVAGSALYKRLSSIINALVDSLISIKDNDVERTEIGESLDKVFASVRDDEGLHPLLQQILSLIKHEDLNKRVVILERLPNFFNSTHLDYGIYIQELVTQLILLLDDDDARIVKGAFESLTALVKNQNKTILETLVAPAAQALRLTGNKGEELAAFKLPRGPNCVLPIFLHGLMYGSSDQRESSALAIADIVSKTPATNLKPFVTIITGPLIRVVGERFNSDIKAAILYALNILFGKIPQFLRPFIPQLQRTFVKSLSDAGNETLRLRAAKALGTLIEYQPKVDPLVVELVSGAKQATDPGVKAAMLKAIMEVVTKAGKKLNQTSKNNIIELVEEEILSADDKLAIAYARLIGALSEILTTDEAIRILNEKVLETGNEVDSESRKFGILTLNAFLRDAPQHIFDMKDQIIEYLISASDSKVPYISDNGLVAIGKIMLLENEKKTPYSNIESTEPFHLGEENSSKLVTQLCKCMVCPASNSPDSRRLSLVIVRTLARCKYEEAIHPNLGTLVPNVFSCVRDSIIPIKLAAEKAYLSIFRLIEEPDNNTFNKWMEAVSGESSITNAADATIQLRSISEYTKRVGSRLARVERDRIEAGGDAEAMFSDRFEDENEIWAVGGVDMNVNDI